jgi:chromosome segregation ATPase
MTRLLTFLNFLGVLALAALSVQQWQVNRALNLKAADLEQIRLDQTAQIAAQDKTIKGYVADLDDFRQRLDVSEAALQKSRDVVAQRNIQINQLTAQRERLLAEMDDLKKSLATWQAAVAQRDASLKQDDAQITKLSADRDDAVIKFNDLAKKYKSLVEDWNKQQAALAKAAAAATQPAK